MIFPFWDEPSRFVLLVHVIYHKSDNVTPLEGIARAFSELYKEERFEGVGELTIVGREPE